MHRLSGPLYSGALVLALVAVLTSAAGCGEEVAVADAGSGGGGFAIDGGPRPHFRDAGGCGGGPSGTSGSGTSGTSGEGCATGDSADAAPPDAAPACDLHTFEYAGTATSVWVSGDFTSWATTPAEGAWVLIAGTDGVFRRSGQIGAGRHIYKLIIDETQWIADPANPNTEPDGIDGVNSVVEVCGGPD